MALIQVNDKIRIDPDHVTQIDISTRVVVLSSGKQHTLKPDQLQALLAHKTAKQQGGN